MAKYTGNTLTNLGKDLLARAVIGGEALTFTKVELGKGVPGGDYEELTGLIESFKVLAITSTAKLEGGSYRVRTAFSNSGITEDTYLREIGVFARGEDGIEILYSYCYTDTPDLIPAEGAGVLERVEDVITYVSNAANVNAVIDQSKVYATIKDLTEGLAGKEDKFDKNSGFNLDKTDSAETESSILVATAKAVKKVWDKAKEAIGFTDTNRAAILNNTEQIESLSKAATQQDLNYVLKGSHAFSSATPTYTLNLSNGSYLLSVLHTGGRSTVWMVVVNGYESMGSAIKEDPGFEVEISGNQVVIKYLTGGTTTCAISTCKVGYR